MLTIICPAVLQSAIVETGIGYAAFRDTAGTWGVLAPDIALCEECPKKRQNQAISNSRSLTSALDADRSDICLLAQGSFVWPATRSGCGDNVSREICPAPAASVRLTHQDQGAKILSALASQIEAKDEKEIDKTLTTIRILSARFIAMRCRHRC